MIRLNYFQLLDWLKQVLQIKRSLDLIAQIIIIIFPQYAKKEIIMLNFKTHPLARK